MQVSRGLEDLVHKLLDIRFVDPGCAETRVDLRCFEVSGLRSFQRLYVGGVEVRLTVRGAFGNRKLVTHIAREILIRG